MKKVIFLFSAIALALAGAFISNAKSNVLLQNAYVRISSTQCDPTQVDNDCSTDGTTACVVGKIIYKYNAPCSTQLFKP